MKRNFGLFMEELYKREGYYSNHGWDAGGETLYGISRRYNPDWRGWKIFDSFKIGGNIPSTGKVFPLLKEHIEQLYKKNYWDRCRCDDLPAGIDLFVADSCVNPGDHFIRFKLQYLVEAYPDGIIGPNTVAQVKRADPERLLSQLHDLRGVYYAMNSNPRVREKAIKGWIARNRIIYNKCRKLLADRI